MAQFTENQLIPNNIGRATLNGLDVIFTSVSAVNKTHNLSSPILDPIGNVQVRLVGIPSYDSLTLKTPKTKAATRKINEWLRTSAARENNVGVSIVSAEVVYTYTKCTVSQSPLSPEFDADNQSTDAQYLTITVEINDSNLLEIREIATDG